MKSLKKTEEVQTEKYLLNFQKDEENKTRLHQIVDICMIQCGKNFDRKCLQQFQNIFPPSVGKMDK